jgi:hypothetical protein
MIEDWGALRVACYIFTFHYPTFIPQSFVG